MVIKVLNDFLPPAEEELLGAVKVGDTLNIDTDNVLNVDMTSVIGKYYSNCITEIPQTVKLEFDGTTLTLKAGSKAYIPAGNNNTFNLYTTETDLQLLYISSLSGQYFIQLHTDSVQLVPEHLTIQSGDTFPENPTSLQKFYKSDENLIYSYDATRTVWKPATISLPLAIVNIENGEVKDIIQVFNGASYFGHHAFILPGVKGSTPNGITDTSSLSSIDIKITDVIVYDLTTNSMPTYSNRFLIIGGNNYINRVHYRAVAKESELIRQEGIIQYIYETNTDYYWTDSTSSYNKTRVIPFVEVSLRDSTVTYFRIIQPMRLATTEDRAEPTDRFLFDYIWADHIPNKLCWLRADNFSWQDGNVYKAAYDHLVADYQGITATSDTIAGYTVWYYLAADGHKIAGTSQETVIQNIYDATGIAWYYILDEANHKFKLPRTKFAFTGIRDGVGRYVAPGVPNITGIIDVNGNPAWTANGVFRYESNIDTDGQASTTSNSAPFSFDASRSNAIYGASTTVQPPATQMYLYAYVGYTDPMQLKQAEIDLDTVTAKNITRINTATEDGITRLNTDSNALNRTQATNCILEIPQDIEVELSDGVLTLKAGSKVYVPNGSGVYNQLTINSDLSYIVGGSETTQHMLFYYSDGFIETRKLNEQESGTTTPTSGYFTYYNTDDNKIYRIQNGVNTGTASLPIALVSSVNGQVTTIDQLFNGFGYIGSTVFALPGVKGLIPNGRNADGTLNNILFERTTINTYTFGGNYTGTMVLGLNSNNGFDGDTIRFVEQASKPAGNNWTWLNINTNTLSSNYWNGSGYSDTQLQCCMFMSGYRTNDKIDWINFKLPLHTLDYYTLASITTPYLIDLGTTSGTLTLTTNTTYKLIGNGTITFTLPTAPTLGISNTIRILYYQSAARTITWGTNYFYNGNVPDMTVAGYYDIYFDYNPILNQWVCGALTQEIA